MHHGPASGARITERVDCAQLGALLTCTGRMDRRSPNSKLEMQHKLRYIQLICRIFVHRFPPALLSQRPTNLGGPAGLLIAQTTAPQRLPPFRRTQLSVCLPIPGRRSYCSPRLCHRRHFPIRGGRAAGAGPSASGRRRRRATPGHPLRPGAVGADVRTREPGPFAMPTVFPGSSMLEMSAADWRTSFDMMASGPSGLTVCALGGFASTALSSFSPPGLQLEHGP